MPGAKLAWPTFAVLCRHARIAILAPNARLGEAESRRVAASARSPRPEQRQQLVVPLAGRMSQSRVRLALVRAVAGPRRVNRTARTRRRAVRRARPLGARPAFGRGRAASDLGPGNRVVQPGRCAPRPKPRTRRAHCSHDRGAPVPDDRAMDRLAGLASEQRRLRLVATPIAEIRGRTRLGERLAAGRERRAPDVLRVGSPSRKRDSAGRILLRPAAMSAPMRTGSRASKGCPVIASTYDTSNLLRRAPRDFSTAPASSRHAASLAEARARRSRLIRTPR